jgi:branched-chain amino acid transport system permease protein
MFYQIQLLNAVQYGLLLFLLSSGLTLIFGIMGVINLAHGSFYMVGGYLAYSLAKMTGNVWLALPLIPISLSEEWNLITRISREQVSPS